MCAVPILKINRLRLREVDTTWPFCTPVNRWWQKDTSSGILAPGSALRCAHKHVVPSAVLPVAPGRPGDARGEAGGPWTGRPVTQRPTQE